MEATIPVPAPPGAAAKAPRPVFEIEGLHIDYVTELGVLHAVRDVSLTVNEHESFGLVGESGSGKSTLAMGSIRYLASNGRVTDGSVRLNGVELLGLPAKELRQLWGSRIGVVYQSPLSALNPSIVIGKQLAEVARQHLGMDRSAASTRVVEMLTKVAMPDPEAVMKRYPHQLSGGMLQRCVIAMALMTDPSLLIMDEPTTALDVTTQAVVLDLVADLKREFDSAILYITHDLGVITKICDRVGVMYAGQFMEQAALYELFKRPLHPYTLDLLGCVPHFDPTPQKRSLVTIPGAIPRVDQLPPGCIFAPRCKFVEEACTTARPPLVEVAGAHLSACRRWEVVPPPAEYLREATEAVRAAQTETARPGLLVEGDDVQVHFKAPKGVIRAVDGMDLEVRIGETLGVVGESGSGKTTVARAIIGLTPSTGGTITLRGKQLPRSTGRASARDAQKRSRWSSRTPTRRSIPTRSVGDAIMRPLALLGGLGRQAGQGEGQGAAAGGEPARELLRAPAARAERRREAARGDRARLRRRARAHPLRRADLVARRLGAGLAHEPAHEAPGREADVVRLHLARPLGGPASLGCDRRRLPRPRDGDRRRHRACSRRRSIPTPRRCSRPSRWRTRTSSRSPSASAARCRARCSSPRAAASTRGARASSATSASSRSHRGARARATIASTVTSRSRSSPACRPRRSCWPTRREGA